MGAFDEVIRTGAPSVFATVFRSQALAYAGRCPEALRHADVMQQVDAYNRRDLEAFLATYAPDVRWYAVPDSLIDSGLERAREIYSRMFAELPDLKAEIRGKMVSGNFVVLRESVTGLRSGVPLDAVVIYEVKGEKISRVWFFP